MATRLSEIKYEPSPDAQFLQDIVTWGVDPLIALADVAEEEIDEKQEKTHRLCLIIYDIVNHLQDLKEALDRIVCEMIEGGRRKNKLAPLKKED